MAKDKIINLRTHDDLIKTALDVSGDNITNTIEVALREYVMHHKPKIELLYEEKKRIEDRLEEIKAEINNVVENLPKGNPEAIEKVTGSVDLSEREWEYIRTSVENKGLTETLENIHMIMNYAKKLGIPQTQLKDMITERYQHLDTHTTRKKRM